MSNLDKKVDKIIGELDTIDIEWLARVPQIDLLKGIYDLLQDQKKVPATGSYYSRKHHTQTVTLNTNYCY